MRGSIVWTMVISLLLGCVLGAGGMGAVLLPIQFQLQQDKIAALQMQDEFAEQQRLNEQEYEKKAKERLDREKLPLIKQNNELTRRLDAAIQRIAVLERQLQQKKP